MKRVGITLARIAAWDNLTAAFYQAAKGRGENREIEQFRVNLTAELTRLQRDVLAGQVTPGVGRHFRIRDPKPRDIYAPDFRDRVLHHALMAHIAPVLDRTLIDDTYACRSGKGGFAAVQRCQQHLQRFAHFIQIDILGYFAHIDHWVLLRLLARRFKDVALLKLLWQIIHPSTGESGVGLPIGALTSQVFANYYVAGLDRVIQENPKVRGMVRYMDDFIWFCDSKEDGLAILHLVDAYLATELRLVRKPNYRYGKSVGGTVFCGYRILPGAIRLTHRKRQRFSARRRFWEQAWLRGEISDLKLQNAYASVVGMTTHADATSWRKQQLQRVPLVGGLDDV